MNDPKKQKDEEKKPAPAPVAPEEEPLGDPPPKPDTLPAFPPR